MNGIKILTSEECKNGKKTVGYNNNIDYNPHDCCPNMYYTTRGSSTTMTAEKPLKQTSNRLGLINLLRDAEARLYDTAQAYHAIKTVRESMESS